MDDPKLPVDEQSPEARPERTKKRRGWAAMSLETRTAIAKKGGAASASSPRHRGFSHEEAVANGKRRWAVAKARAAATTTETAVAS